MLYRDFLLRLVDLEFLSAGGDLQKLFAQFAALLGAFSFVLAVFLVPRYAFSKLPPEKLALAAWGDQEFLIATTMAIAGMFAVVTWNAIYPDRRDSLILGMLPVRTQTIFGAKVCAVATGLGIGVGAINIATGMSYPFVVVPPAEGALGTLRSFGAYWITMAAAGAYSKGFLYGDSRMYAALRQHIGVPRFHEPNVPFLAAGFVMLFFTVIGVRAVFSLPAALKANWIFRVTAVHSPRAYFTAVRKALYVLSATPVWIAAAMVYLTIWPAGPVMAHLVVLALVSVILIERSLHEFRKVPFACSYLPGKADLRQRLAIYGILLLFLIDVGTRVEHWAMQSRSRYIVLLAILLALAIRARKRWNAFATAFTHRIQFEDLETAEVAPLDLRRDAAWGNERYIDAADAEPERPLRLRIRSALMKTAITTLGVPAAGAIYEQYGQWQHRRHFPRIGQSVDIGGRTLNIFCSGETGPTVIFESGAGGPGYGWMFIQREVSKFARACWYDRAGYGWSDSGPYPRDGAAVARDLRELLGGAGIAPPYVLVGASFGGFCVRIFNGLYPNDVAGMVLADSSHMDERDSIPPFGKRGPSPGLLYAASVFAQALRWVGVLRVVMDDDPGPPPKGLTPHEWLVARSFEPRTFAEHSKSLFLESAKQARAAGGLGSRPLIVLTAGLPGKARNPMEARQALAGQRHWIEIQGQLARLSRRGKQVVVQDSGHCIQCDAPEAIVEAVREVVAEARGSPAGDKQ